jgi:hypothetical protein
VKKLSLVALLVILSACKSEKGDAIHAQVLLPSVVATCVRFEVRDPTSDQPIETRWLTRSDDDLKIAIFKGSFPETVKLAARPYRDGDCRDDAQDAPIPNGPYKTAEATFVKDDITQASLQLEPGPDGDRDGYVAMGAGGADCQDAPGQEDVHPGAPEECSDQTDLNCDDTKGCEASTCGPNACVGPPTNLVLTLEPSSVESGTCTSAAIQVRDASGRNTTVSTATVVGLEAAPASGIAFFSNPACTTPITSVNLAVGEGGATFYFRGQVVGDVTINATAGQLQDSKVAHVVPGPGNRLVFTSPARNVMAGTCSTVQFQSQDAQGAAVPVTAATAVTLAASPATDFRFYSDPGCTTEVTSANIPAGMSSGSFSFRGTRSGTVAVALTAAGFTGSAQNETINPGPPAVMVFTGPQTLAAGGCSPPVTIELRDSFGNLAPAASATSITLASSGVALTYSTNSDCSSTTTSVSIAQGASTTSFHYRGTAAGTTNISGTATGLTTQTPLAVTITPGAPTLAFTTSAQPQTAGICSAVATVQRRDSFGNPIRVAADTPVALSAAPPTGFQFFTDSNCLAAPVTSVNIPADGSDASFYFKGTIVGSGTVMISATVAGIPAATQNVTLNPGPPTVLAFSPLSVTMAAGACTQFTLLVQDTLGNASPVSSNQAITFTPSPSTGFTFSANSDCSSPGTQFDVASGQSSRVLYMRGTAVADVMVTASGTGFDPETLSVKVNPGAPNKLAFTTNPQTVLVETCSGITTVQVQDAFNNPTSVAASTQIDLASNSSGGMVFYSDSACNIQATFVTVLTGQDSASFYFKDSNPEAVMITAASTGLTSATQTETIEPLPATALVFVTNPQTVAATGCSAVATVETWAGGTPTTVTTPTTVNLSASTPPGLTFYLSSNCTGPLTSVTIAAGQGSANFYFRGATPGTVTVTAASNGLTSATQDETITPPPTKLLFSTPARTTVAGVCSAVVTVQSADATSNPVPVIGNTTVNLSQSTPIDPQFRFYSDANCSTTPIMSVSIPARQNSANLYYKGVSAPRTVTLTAAAGGLTSATQDHTMVVGDAAALVFAQATPAQTLLAGTCSNLRTVETRDAVGNLATNGATVTFAGSTTVEVFQDPNCTIPITGPVTIAAGNSTTGFYFKGFTGGINANGTLTLTASATGLTNGMQDETIIPTVRTGNCTLTNAGGGCGTITPALLNENRAFVVFNATSTNATSDQANVRCFVNSPSQVRCERADAGGADVSIRWSVAEFPSGVDVQHLPVNCGSDTTNVPLPNNVTVNRTFLLLSSQRNTATMDSSVPRLAELMATNRAEIRKTGGCVGGENNHLQVVDYAGASVQRAVSVLANGNPSAQADLPSSVDPARSVLLYSYISDGSGTTICNRVLRGELTNNGAKVTFSRGDGNAASCVGAQFNAISWEVVQFPSGTVVQQVTQPLGAGAAGQSASTQISPVDLSRTIVVGGGQWASGQLHGEGSHALGDLISEMRAQAYLTDSTTLNFSRDSFNSTAKFTAYVIQFKP